MTDNKSHMAALNKLYRMPSQNEKLINMLHKKIQVNNSMLGSLSKNGQLKNMVGHTYTLTNPDGSKNSIIHYGVKGSIMPYTMPGPGGTYVLGKTAAAPGAGSGKESMELARRAKADARYTHLKSGIDALESKIGQEDAIMQLVATDKEGRSEAWWTKLFKGSSESAKKNLESQLRNMIKLYEGKTWFLGTIEQNDPMGYLDDPRGLPKRKKRKRVNKLTPEQQRGH
jgi:hypothetical protein